MTNSQGLATAAAVAVGLLILAFKRKSKKPNGELDPPIEVESPTLREQADQCILAYTNCEDRKLSIDQKAKETIESLDVEIAFLTKTRDDLWQNLDSRREPNSE